jgi:hypothetical protein
MILEAILTAIVLFLVLLMMGVPFGTIIGWALILLYIVLLLTVVLFVIFFAATGISLLFFRRVNGEFLRFEDSGRFDRAVYRADGQVYTCLFPAENVARRRIYSEDSGRLHMLLVSRSAKRRIAYDRHSLVIITIGIVFSAILVFLSVWGTMLLQHYLT